MEKSSNEGGMYQNTRITTLISQVGKWHTLGDSKKPSSPTPGRPSRDAY